MDESGLVEHWRSSCARPEVAAALAAVERMVEDAIEARRPICETSGRCCRFESYGHRLYATGLETAHALSRLGDVRRGAPEVTAGEVADAIARGGCPFQVDGLCSVHTIRPVGCRVYFCDATAQEWVERTAERAHEAIRRVHDEHGIEYRYADWRAMLERFAV